MLWIRWEEAWSGGVSSTLSPDHNDEDNDDDGGGGGDDDDDDDPLSPDHHEQDNDNGDKRCNDNDFNGFSESPNQFLRKQLGPQRLTFNSVSDQGEIIANTIPYTNNESGNNVSTSDSNISRNSTSFLFLHPFTHKNNNTAPIPSLSHPNPISINDTSKNTSIE